MTKYFLYTCILMALNELETRPLTYRTCRYAVIPVNFSAGNHVQAIYKLRTNACRLAFDV